MPFLSIKPPIPTVKKPSYFRTKETQPFYVSAEDFGNTGDFYIDDPRPLQWRDRIVVVVMLLAIIASLVAIAQYTSLKHQVASESARADAAEERELSHAIEIHSIREAIRAGDHLNIEL